MTSNNDYKYSFFYFMVSFDRLDEYIMKKKLFLAVFVLLFIQTKDVIISSYE